MYQSPRWGAIGRCMVVKHDDEISIPAMGGNSIGEHCEARKTRINPRDGGQ